MRLALALRMSIAEVRAMPHSEFAAWESYYEYNPYGEEIDDYRFAFQTFAIVTALTGKQPGKIEDFLAIRRGKPTRDQGGDWADNMMGWFKDG